MADPSTKKQHIFRLSALDQSVSRTYITVAFCYPCDDEHAEAASSRFVASLKKIVSYLPILAGTMRPSSDRDGAERGYLKVAVSIDMANSFMPAVKNLAGTDVECGGYDALRSKRFPAEKLEIMHLAPLAQQADFRGGQAFAAQVNTISGGLIAVLQLHHSVADTASFRTIVKCLSMTDDPRDITHDFLSQQAAQWSKARDLLSDAGGLAVLPSAPTALQPNLGLTETAQSEMVTCVLGFNLALIDGTTTMVNDRFFGTDGLRRKAAVSAFHVLASILWRAVIRARKTADLLHLTPVQNVLSPLPSSRIIIPVNIRERMQPELKATFFGNAIAQGSNGQSIISLAMPIGISEIQATASLVRAAIDEVTERTVRLAIAKAQQSDYSDNTATTNANTLTDVVVTSWSDLLPKEAHLCLGLGEPSFVRKLSSKDADEGCNIHGRPTEGDIEGGIWEVTVTLAGKAMEALLEDEGVMRFVDYADGERYVNGRTEFMDAGHQITLEDEHERNQQRTAWRGRLGLINTSAMGGDLANLPQ